MNAPKFKRVTPAPPARSPADAPTALPAAAPQDARPVRSRAKAPPNAPAASADPRTTRVIAEAITAWFPAARRSLPWRTPERNPYHALIAETMLQQTQVSRVVEYFQRFIGRFPTLADLAAADEHDVLALWSGLGYYRRAKNLHAAARRIVADHAAAVPASPDTLADLPGVGPYTAGAIASIVFNQPAAIVDGNVLRVLLRVEGRDLDPAAPATRAWAWARAKELVEAAPNPADFNEGLMELGATVCLPPPATPRCGVCPLRTTCRARLENLIDHIPRPKPTRATPTIHCATVLAFDAPRRRLLLERRPASGMWAGLWQPPTAESASPIRPRDVAKALGIDAELLRPLETFTYQTTHRTLRFRVYETDPQPWPATDPPRRWFPLKQVPDLPLSSAQRKVLALGGIPASPTIKVDL